MAKAGDGGRGAAAVGMVVARLFLGGYLLYSGLTHLVHPAAFIHFVQANCQPGGNFVEGNLWPQYAHLLKVTVAPHAAAVAWGMMLVEALAGLLLLVGFLTRLAGALALVLSASLVLATLHLVDPRLGVSAGAIAGAFTILALGVILSAAGRTFGIDQAIVRKSKSRLLW